MTATAAPASDSSSPAVLIVVDGDHLDWIPERQRHPGVRCILLPLGISAAAYLREHGAELARHGVEVWHPGPAALEAREAIQRRYPQFVFDLARRPIAGRSLLDRLDLGDVNLWWLIETSEKSVFRCSLVNHMYFLELLSRAQRETGAGELWIDVRCPYLERTLRSIESRPGAPVVRVCAPPLAPWRPRTPFFFRLLARRVVLFGRLLSQYVALRAGRLQQDPRGLRLVLHANYPSMWIRGTSADAQDRHYGILAEALSRWKPTGYVVHLQIASRELWRLRRAVAAIWRRNRILPVLQFAGLRGVLSVLSPRVFRRLVAARGAMVRLPPIEHDGWNVAPIVERELDCALEHNEPALDLLWVRGLRALFARQPMDFIVHSGEFQPFEKAIWYAARERGVRAVSFQHSMSSPMFLSYHFGAGELASYVREPAAPGAMPTPSLFATTGEYAAEAVIGAGFPSNRVCVCGPIRYHSLVQMRAERKSKAEARRALGLETTAPIVLVATTSKHRDNLNMMQSLSRALARHDAPAMVLFKAHPQVTPEAERELIEIGKGLAPPLEWHRFAEEQPLSAMLAASDVLLTNSSATGVEAMALDVVPIFFHNPHLYDLSILYSLPESVLFATDHEELAVALEDALSGRAAERLSPRWGADLRRLLGPLDGSAEGRFLEFLQRAGCAGCAGSKDPAYDYRT
jgi:hypothetical protein